MAKITIYSSNACPYCSRAKMLLDNKGLSYQEIRVDLEPGKMEEMIEKSGRKTVPQIFIGETHVGGCDDLYAWNHSGKLDEVLSQN